MHSVLKPKAVRKAANGKLTDEAVSRVTHFGKSENEALNWDYYQSSASSVILKIDRYFWCDSQRKTG